MKKGIKVFKTVVTLRPEKELIKDLVKKTVGKIEVPKSNNNN